MGHAFGAASPRPSTLRLRCSVALTVLSVAHPFAPVGPCGVGSAERILAELDAALVAEGHRSLVVACAGSLVAGELFSAPMPERALISQSDRRWHRWRFQAAIDRALSRHRVDLIHMHGVDFDQHVLPPEIPLLVTLHAPIGWYRPEAWVTFGDRAQFQCVSLAQRNTCPELSDVPVIENGVPLPEVRLEREREDFALALGRISPEKNVHEALEAGTRAGIRVLVGGRVFPNGEDGEYFSERVQPLLNCDGMTHRYLGPMEAERRQRLLARAKCLLLSTRAQETTSLTAMEALSVGTPVIAYRSGALTEIVDDGVTGFLVDSVEEMADAIKRIDQIRPEDCRAAAEQRFSRDRMVRNYFDLYVAMVRREAAAMSA
jgi:glycosyltransferase involved in cell wall biosynthesis